MGNVYMSNDFSAKLSDKKCYFFDESNTLKFIDFLKTQAQVIAPHRKGENSYSYEIVDSASDVVLDYSRTIQPLKKFFLPPVETLLSFRISNNEYREEHVPAIPRIFLGIHSYEMQGIKRLDYSFINGNPESNYLNRREESIFIGVSYVPDKYHFAKSLGIDIEDTDGFCLFFEKAEGGYFVFEINERGARFLKNFGQGQPLNRTVSIEKQEFKSKIKYHYNRLPQVFEKVYHSKVWENVAERCVGCGTCNLLCSTCYCFDVRDEVAMDADEGKRTRFWDGCMLNSFAAVAGGENFRDKLSSRTRHRLYRKFKYVTQASGELHCIGCGRCSKFCPAEINITEIINDLIDDFSEQQRKQVI
jgi:sulfhydrogenase subunit beta (sulfur reductase)